MRADDFLSEGTSADDFLGPDLQPRPRKGVPEDQTRPAVFVNAPRREPKPTKREGWQSVLENETPTDTSLIDFRVQGRARRAAENAYRPQDRRTPPNASVSPGLDEGFLANATRMARESIAGLNTSVAGFVRQTADLNDLPDLSEFARRSAAAGQYWAGKTQGTPTKVEGFAPGSVVQALPGAAQRSAVAIAQQLPALASGAALPMMMAQAAGTQYNQVRNEGRLGVIPAAINATLTGAAEGIGERLGGTPGTVRALRDAIAGNPVMDVGRKLLTAGVRDVPGEQLTTALNYGVDMAPVIGTNPNPSIDDYLSQAKETLGQTILQGGMMTGGGMALARGSRELQEMRGRTPQIELPATTPPAPAPAPAAAPVLPVRAGPPVTRRGGPVLSDAIDADAQTIADQQTLPAVLRDQLDNARRVPAPDAPGPITPQSIQSLLASLGLNVPAPAAMPRENAAPETPATVATVATVEPSTPESPTAPKTVIPAVPVEPDAPAAVPLADDFLDDVVTPEPIAAPDPAVIDKPAPQPAIPEPAAINNGAGLSEQEQRAAKVFQAQLDAMGPAQATDDAATKLRRAQTTEQITNPGRYHPVEEVANPKGLKIGDRVTVNGKPGAVLSVAPAAGKTYKSGFMVKTAIDGTYGGWSDLADVTPQGQQQQQQQQAGRGQPRTEQQQFDALPDNPDAAGIEAAMNEDFTQLASGLDLPARFGVGNTPMDEGGQPFASRDAAKKAQKLQPGMRVIKGDGGFVLAEQTDKQLAAHALAARRLARPQIGKPGHPIAAHEMIAAAGGLAPAERADMNIQRNIRIGNRSLFAGPGRGLTMEKALEKLQQDGYLGEDAGPQEARDLIKRSLNNPQYTPEGWERYAELETESRRQADEDAQREDAIAEAEKLAAVSDDGYMEFLDGFEDGELSRQFGDATMRPDDWERLHKEWYDLQTAESGGAGLAGRTEQAGAGAATPTDRPGDNPPGQSGAGSQGPATDPDIPETRPAAGPTADGTADGLTGQTNQEIIDSDARAAAAEKERVKAERDAAAAERKARDDADVKARGATSADRFVLGGNAEDEISGQGGMFDDPAPAEPAAAVTQATAILDAANVTGKDRIDLLKDVKAGTVTPDDLQQAFPTIDKPDNAGKVDDFGEKLGGARKDQVRTLDKPVTDDEIESQPFSKVWPSDEYLTMDDLFASAVAFAARAEVPSKPRVAYRVARWVESVKLLRSLAQRVSSGALNGEQVRDLLKDRRGLDGFTDKVTLLEAIDRTHWGRIGSVEAYPNSYRYNDDGTQTKTPMVQVSIDGRTQRFDGIGTIADVVERVNTLLGVDAKAPLMQFEVRGRTGSFSINKKGDSERRALKTFTGSKEAFAFIKDNHPELLAAWEAVKDRDNVGEGDVRNAENRPRTGADHRQGQDVTAEKFAATFGFRGIEFGNWVAQGKNAKERQGMLNGAYDALLDLAEIIGVPPRAISLNGTLGLGFGSRGSGIYSAHFEPDTLVINLTKTRGAGTLAHEWFHAMDNYFSHQRGAAPMTRGMSQADYRAANYITYRPEQRYVHKSGTGEKLTLPRLEALRLARPNSPYYKAENWALDPQHKAGVRPEVERRFADLVTALDASPMAARALSIDKAPDGYWSRIIERAARSFENYIISKMLAKGYQNDYLANVREVKDFPRDRARYPYLLPEEVAPVAEAFDALFAEVKTREDGGNLAMFEPPGEYTAEAPKNRGSDDRQLQLFLDSRPVESQTGEASAAARRDAVSAVDDLRSTATILAKALSGDYAARQRVSLVGQEVTRTADLAVLAQVYRDPRFETFRVIYVNDAGTVVAQIGLTSRLPASTAAIVGSDMRTYLDDLHDAAENQGATGYYLLHNHPSGMSTPSQADIVLTKNFARHEELHGGPRLLNHVVIDTNEYSVIDGQGNTQKREHDFGQSPTTPGTGPPAGAQITSPAHLMDMSKALAIDPGAVTLIVTDHRYVVRGITTLPTELVSRWSAQNQTRLAIQRAALVRRGSQVFAVGRDPEQLRRIAGFVVDAVHVLPDGTLNSMAERGAIAGNGKVFGDRRTRLSPDTSEVFNYLREQTKPVTAAQRQAASDRVGEPPPPDITRRSGPLAPQPWTVPEPGAGDNFIRAIQNNKIDLKRIQEGIVAARGEIPDAANAYLNEELYHRKVAARVETLHKESIEPLLRKLAVAGKNAGVTMDDLNQYLHARHAQERNEAMARINPDMADNEALSGMSDAEARSIRAGFIADGKIDALRVLAKDVDALLQDTRTALVADGLEEAETVSTWEAAYKHYVPLQRDITPAATPKGQGVSIRGPESKRAVGSNRKVVNILANIVSAAETGAIRAEKSVVGRSLLAMARRYPNPAFWKVDQVPIKPRIDPDTGLVNRSAIDPMYQTADNVVMVKDYGAEHFIVFNTENERAMAAASAMKNLGIDKMSKIVEVAGKGTRFIASLLTQRNPLFWLTNFSRDIQGVMLNLEGTDAEGLQAKVFGNLPKAFGGMYSLVRKDGTGQWARYAREMSEGGGTTGYMQAFDNSDARMKDLNTIVAQMSQGKADPRRLARVALDFVDDYNEIIENAVRLSVFQAARDSGMSTPKAASLAKNITVNFNRKGNLSPTVNSLYMFFNASVQGTARMAQALATSNKARAIVGGIAAMGFALDLVNRMMAGDDDETGRNRYDLIPEYVKSKNWIFMNPVRPGEYVLVPLPLGPHVFHNAGRLISDAIFRKNPRNAAEYGYALAGTLFDAFAPTGAVPSLEQLITPSLLDPAVQLSQNKGFTGGPVYRSDDLGFGKTDPKPAYTRHFENTPDLWKGASRLLNNITGGDKDKPGLINVEPDIFGHVFYSITGGPGRTLVQSIDSVQASARGDLPNVNRIPLVSRFYGTNDDRQRDRVYFDDRKRVIDAKTERDHYVKAGRPELALEAEKKLGDGDAARGRKLILEFANAGKSIKVINKEIRARMSKADEGDDDQAAALKALRARRTATMGRLARDTATTEQE